MLLCVLMPRVWRSQAHRRPLRILTVGFVTRDGSLAALLRKTFKILCGVFDALTANMPPVAEREPEESRFSRDAGSGSAVVGDLG